jgi:hypothetical protein
MPESLVGRDEFNACQAGTIMRSEMPLAGTQGDLQNFTRLQSRA